MKVIEQILIHPTDKNHTQYVLWSQCKKSEITKNINRKSPNIWKVKNVFQSRTHSGD